MSELSSHFGRILEDGRSEKKNAFENIERIKLMLTEGSIEKINTTVTELIQKESVENTRLQTLILQTSQEKMLQDAIHAFHALEDIRKCISAEEYKKLTDEAHRKVHKEQVDRDAAFCLNTIRTNSQKISNSFKRINDIYIKNRDEILSQEPEKKRVRKNLDEEKSN